MMPTIQLREGPILWSQVHSGVTANALLPTSLTAGIAQDPAAQTHKVHVALVADATAATSCTVALIGLAPSSAMGGLQAVSTWCYLGSLNAGSSITPNTSKWTETGSTTKVALIESFSVNAHYERYSTVVVVGGTGTNYSTWVGFSKA